MQLYAHKLKNITEIIEQNLLFLNYTNIPHGRHFCLLSTTQYLLQLMEILDIQ